MAKLYRCALKKPLPDSDLRVRRAPGAACSRLAQKEVRELDQGVDDSPGGGAGQANDDQGKAARPARPGRESAEAGASDLSVLVIKCHLPHNRTARWPKTAFSGHGMPSERECYHRPRATDKPQTTDLAIRLSMRQIMGSIHLR